MVNLKELIQQAKSGEIPWDAEIKLESKVLIKKSLKNISSENWKKVRHIAPNWSAFWGEGLTQQIEKSDKLIKKDDSKFVSKEVLEEFKKYVGADSELETNKGRVKISEITEDDVITDYLSDITSTLRKEHRIYGRNSDSYAFQNEDALCFLQSIINESFFHTIEYQADETFKLTEWKNDDEKNLNIELESSVNAWKLLNKGFSEDESLRIEELDISDKNLIGELDLSEFPNLKKLDCSDNKLTSLKLNRNTNLLYLDCSYNQLKGKLDLTNNKKLTGLDCSFNELEELAINNCPDLEMLVCNDNKLKNNLKRHLLDNLSPNKLICLNVSDNNLQGSLDDFKKFIKLETLWIGSEEENKIKKEGIYNKFRGSLESLRGLNKLESLHISNTDINGYSDCLPSNVEIRFSTEERPEARLGEIKEKLKEKCKNSPLQLTKLKEELESLKRKIEEMEVQGLIEIPSNQINY